MVITVRKNKLYSRNGQFLKAVDCPRKVSKDDLNRQSDKNLNCSQCHKTVMDTDFMTETQLIELLHDTPDTCLAINLKNPIFKAET